MCVGAWHRHTRMPRTLKGGGQPGLLRNGVSAAATAAAAAAVEAVPPRCCCCRCCSEGARVLTMSAMMRRRPSADLQEMNMGGVDGGSQGCGGWRHVQRQHQLKPPASRDGISIAQQSSCTKSQASAPDADGQEQVGGGRAHGLSHAAGHLCGGGSRGQAVHGWWPCCCTSLEVRQGPCARALPTIPKPTPTSNRQTQHAAQGEPARRAPGGASASWQSMTWRNSPRCWPSPPSPRWLPAEGVFFRPLPRRLTTWAGLRSAFG